MSNNNASCNGIASTNKNLQPYSLKLHILSGHSLPIADYLTSDPYVAFKLGSRKIAKTTTKHSTLNPVWNEKFTIPLLHLYSKLKLLVFDYDSLSADDLLGVITIDLKKLEINTLHEFETSLEQAASSSVKARGYLKYTITIKHQTDLIHLKAVENKAAELPVPAGLPTDLLSDISDIAADAPVIKDILRDASNLLNISTLPERIFYKHVSGFLRPGTIDINSASNASHISMPLPHKFSLLIETYGNKYYFVSRNKCTMWMWLRCIVTKDVSSFSDSVTLFINNTEIPATATFENRRLTFEKMNMSIDINAVTSVSVSNDYAAPIDELDQQFQLQITTLDTDLHATTEGSPLAPHQSTTGFSSLAYSELTSRIVMKMAGCRHMESKNLHDLVPRFHLNYAAVLSDHKFDESLHILLYHGSEQQKIVGEAVIPLATLHDARRASASSVFDGRKRGASVVSESVNSVAKVSTHPFNKATSFTLRLSLLSIASSASSVVIKVQPVKWNGNSRKSQPYTTRLTLGPADSTGYTTVTFHYEVDIKLEDIYWAEYLRVAIVDASKDSTLAMTYIPIDEFNYTLTARKYVLHHHSSPTSITRVGSIDAHLRKQIHTRNTPSETTPSITIRSEVIPHDSYSTGYITSVTTTSSMKLPDSKPERYHMTFQDAAALVLKPLYETRHDTEFMTSLSTDSDFQYVEFHCFENERKTFHYSKQNLFSMERKPYTDETGEQIPVYNPGSDAADVTIIWTSDWEVDKSYTATDDMGWVYGIDFQEISRFYKKQIASVNPGIKSVRRRKWVRQAKIPLKYAMQRESEMDYEECIASGDIVIPYNQIIAAHNLTPSVAAVTVIAHKKLSARGGVPIELELFVQDCISAEIVNCLQNRIFFEDIRFRARQCNNQYICAQQLSPSGAMLKEVNQTLDEVQQRDVVPADVVNRLFVYRRCLLHMSADSVEKNSSLLQQHLREVIDSINLQFMDDETSVDDDPKLADDGNDVNYATDKVKLLLEQYEVQILNAYVHFFYSSDLIVPLLQMIINRFYAEVLAVLGIFFDSSNPSNTVAIQNLKGNAKKIEFITAFLSRDTVMYDTLKPLITLLAVTTTPQPLLSAALDIRSVISWYGEIVTAEMKGYTINCINVHTKDDFHQSRKNVAYKLPWDVSKERNIKISFLPREAHSLLSTYLTLPRQSLLCPTSEPYIAMLEESIKNCYLECFALLSDAYLDVLSKYDWTAPIRDFGEAEVDTVMSKHIDFLSSVANDCHRVLNVYLLSLSANSASFSQSANENFCQLFLENSERYRSLIAISVDYLSCIIYKSLVTVLSTTDLYVAWHKDAGRTTVSVVVKALHEYIDDFSTFLERSQCVSLIDHCLLKLHVWLHCLVVDCAKKASSFSDAERSQLLQDVMLIRSVTEYCAGSFGRDYSESIYFLDVINQFFQITWESDAMLAMVEEATSGGWTAIIVPLLHLRGYSAKNKNDFHKRITAMLGTTQLSTSSVDIYEIYSLSKVLAVFNTSDLTQYLLHSAKGRISNEAKKVQRSPLPTEPVVLDRRSVLARHASENEHGFDSKDFTDRSSKVRLFNISISGLAPMLLHKKVTLQCQDSSATDGIRSVTVVVSDNVLKIPEMLVCGEVLTFELLMQRWILKDVIVAKGTLTLTETPARVDMILAMDGAKQFTDTSILLEFEWLMSASIVEK